MDFDFEVMPTVLGLAAAGAIGLSVWRLRALSAGSYGSWRRWMERGVLTVAMLVALIVGGSSVFNAMAMHRFWAAHPAPGTMLLVDGRRMHLDCTGVGSPTLVLDAGLGNDSVVWGQVQPILARTTRVCSYDRAGFGWSEARGGVRDAEHVAAELHGLLTQAGVTGPVILMGHSIAGLYLREYAMRFPTQVAGLVFLDSSTPYQDRDPEMKATEAKGPKGPPEWLLRAAMMVGVPRWLGMCGRGTGGAEADFKKVRAEDICRVHYGAISAEANSFDRSSEEMVRSGPFGAMPVLVISHDPAKLMAGQKATPEYETRQAMWSRMQEDLKKLSTRSRRIVALGSTHNVATDRTELVEREVALFVEQVRGTAAIPTVFGTTVTE